MHHHFSHMHYWAAMLSVAIGVLVSLAVVFWTALSDKRIDPKA
jgi:hypothetical protein